MCRLRILIALTAAVIATPLLLGCGAVPGATASVSQSAEGIAIARLGFGAEGGTQPAIVQRANGEWLTVYVGTNVANRHLYWSRSTDGARWSAPASFAAAAYSDQTPALVEDAQGVVHCFFASNRGGETFELFHTTFDGTAWGDADRVPGYTGIQDLAAAYANGRFLIAAEVMAEGLLTTTSADGQTFTVGERIADAGFEPAATFLPDGTALVAYTRGNELIVRAGQPGVDWADEQVVASTASRLRGPALAWTGDHGKLIYTERASAGMTYQLREKRFDADLSFTNGTLIGAFTGDASSPAVSVGNNKARVGLAWGMKLSSSQQGIAFTLDGWK